MKRIFLILFALVFLFLPVLTACGNTPEEPAPPAEEPTDTEQTEKTDKEEEEEIVTEPLDPFVPDTVCFEASDLGSNARRPFFPGVTQAKDGTILVVYYYADGHALYHQSEGKLSGVLQLVRSTDHGKTWSEPETVVDVTGEDKTLGLFNRESRDPNLQRLSDGTIVLTYSVRAPIGKPGYNDDSRAYDDYWYERAYYMTSVDNGKTFSTAQMIPCDYFSTEPYLYDDPTRTTGAWVKNGSMAELEGGDVLISLYGSKDCSSRGILETVIIKAHNNGNGKLTFDKTWAPDGGDAVQLAGPGGGNEVSLVAYGDTVYALSRTASNDSASNAPVYISKDAGKTWERFATEVTPNECLNQPYFTLVSDKLALVNYAVPLASAASSPAKRTARPVYGKLFDLEKGNWDEYTAVPVYDVQSATVADMGNPASVLLDDGRIFTVFYDTSSPATKHGFIGGQFTTLSDYE